MAEKTVWEATIFAYGNSSYDSDPDNDGNIFEMNFRYPGQYFDYESGLHYNYFRYYDPRLGRYITPDPIGQAGGNNIYGYAGGGSDKFY